MEILALLAVGFLCGLIAAMIGQRKGAAGSGFLLGLLLGPLGIVIALVMRGNRVACPHCKELVQKAASVCPHCRERLAQPSRARTRREQLAELRRRDRARERPG